MIRNFWIRAWSEDQYVHTHNDFIIIGLKSGMSDEVVTECLEMMKTEDVKRQLKDVTAEAVDRGAFGSPTMFFADETGGNEQMFWGSDR